VKTVEIKHQAKRVIVIVTSTLQYMNKKLHRTAQYLMQLW